MSSQGCLCLTTSSLNSQAKIGVKCCGPKSNVFPHKMTRNLSCGHSKAHREAALGDMFRFNNLLGSNWPGRSAVTPSPPMWLLVSASSWTFLLWLQERQDTSREWPNSSSFRRCGYENIDLTEDHIQSSLFGKQNKNKPMTNVLRKKSKPQKYCP